MTIKHIQDQIEDYADRVAMDSFQLGMEEARKLFVENAPLQNIDDIQDELHKIVIKNLKG